MMHFMDPYLCGALILQFRLLLDYTVLNLATNNIDLNFGVAMTMSNMLLSIWAALIGNFVV